MPSAVVLPAKATKYTIKDKDTLEKIAQANSLADWTLLALYNFGTSKPREVNNSLMELVRCTTVDLASPEKTEMSPEEGKTPELLIPKAWASDAFDLDQQKRHVVTLKTLKPATAIHIVGLDKWFIPGLEECPIEYELDGLKVCADKVELEIYGSKYVKCDTWADGYGTYTDLPDVPVFKQTKELDADEGGSHEVQIKTDDGKKRWKGQSNATDGIFKVKQKDKTSGKDIDRVINVAFSPYTVVMRYYKDDADKDARINLDPFWVQWEDKKTDVAGTGTASGGNISIAWTNADDVDRATLEVKDKDGQVVYILEIPDDKLKKGAQTVTWNKTYRPEAINSKLGNTMIGDDGAYTYPITSITYKLIPDSLKLKWEVKNTTKLKSGLLEIVDGTDAVVFQARLDKAAIDKGEFEWKDGKYSAPQFTSKKVENSKQKDVAIPDDMPYRVQIRAHSAVNEEKGLALAAMHTEVRLYVPPKTRVPKDVAYQGRTAPQGMRLALGSFVPGDEPEEPASVSATAGGDDKKKQTKWIRYKLAQYGYHPGPVTDASAADAVYKIALQEFKRSVPVDGAAGAGSFARQDLSDAAWEQENAGVKTAINSIRDGDKRYWFADPANLASNQDTPDYHVPSRQSGDSAKGDNDSLMDDLADQSKELALWVDDRSCYTQSVGSTPPKDDANADALSPTFGMRNYRGPMTNGDTKITMDTNWLARPWVPLESHFTLLSREEKLNGRKAEDDSEVDFTALSDERKTAMAKAIGPLRVDWTFDELPMDLSQIGTDTSLTYVFPDSAAARSFYDPDFIRSKYYVGWATLKYKKKFKRKDTDRDTIYTNCRSDLGGLRPEDGSIDGYYKEAFGTGDLSLAPWKAAEVSTTQSVATVVHEHMYADQQKDKVLFPDRIGKAGAYFWPSRVAGDGYRVRAEVQFDKFTGYELKNNENLKKRYPVPPQVHTAGIRIWRRASFRAYMAWGAASGNWGNTFINEVRRNYKQAHVYLVHEGDGTATTLASGTLFAGTTGATRFKNTIKNNVPNWWDLRNTATMAFSDQYVWAWATAADFGMQEGFSTDQPGVAEEKFNGWAKAIWNQYREGLLIAVLKGVEAQGYLRGHLMAEFDTSADVALEPYGCAGGHFWWFAQKGSDATPRMNNTPCQTGGCTETLTHIAGHRITRKWDLDAGGMAMGTAWLFKNDNNDRLKAVWVHEMGHHRHLEHAANAPYFTENLHDSEDNAKANWAGVKPPPGNDGWPEANVTEARGRAKRWDRRCIMSYTDCWYLELGGFCGRCLLRNRGWKVTTLGFPGTDKCDA